MKVLFVIADQKFSDNELFHTREELEREGHKVTVVNKSGTDATGMLGGKSKPDMRLDEIKDDQYSAIVFVGGSGSTQYFKDDLALELVKRFYMDGKIVAAICIAPNILANAGLLEGKRATVFGDGEDIKSKGAIFTGNPVEVIGRIVTANGPEASREFGKKIAELL